MATARGNPGLKGQLRDSSIDAFICALETINRISIGYRVQNFVFLLCNAWELLLKARLIEISSNDREVIYEKPKRSKGEKTLNSSQVVRKTISLRVALNKVFNDERSTIRSNLEKVISFRDDSTHFVLGKVPQEIMGLFQACVINYHDCLVHWFSIKLSEKYPIGMMSIVYDYSNVKTSSLKKIRGYLAAKEAQEFLELFAIEIEQEHRQTEFPNQFLVTVEYKLTLAKGNQQDSIKLDPDSPGGSAYIPIHLPEDPAVKYPHYFSDILELLNNKLQLPKPISSWTLNKVNEIYSIKGNKLYHFRINKKGSRDLYNDGYLDWLVSQYAKYNLFFHDTAQGIKRIQ
jgi:hypothetical protein